MLITVLIYKSQRSIRAGKWSIESDTLIFNRFTQNIIVAFSQINSDSFTRSIPVLHLIGVFLLFCCSKLIYRSCRICRNRQRIILTDEIAILQYGNPSDLIYELFIGKI